MHSVRGIQFGGQEVDCVIFCEKRLSKFAINQIVNDIQYLRRVWDERSAEIRNHIDNALRKLGLDQPSDFPMQIEIMPFGLWFFPGDNPKGFSILVRPMKSEVAMLALNSYIEVLGNIPLTELASEIHSSV